METNGASDSKGSRSCSSASFSTTKESSPDLPPDVERGPDDFRPKAPVWTPSQFKPRDYAEIKRLSNEPANTSANETQKKRNVREYTLGEEVANSITHGIGALLAIAAIPILIVLAVGSGGGMYLFAGLVYGITILLEYTMSTLYHAIAAEKAKRVFKILDHSCIYLLIAGTYTPFCLITLSGVGGIWLCIFVWVVALIGVACEAFWVFRPRWVAALLYLLLGWSVIWFLPALFELLAPAGFWLLLAGGLCYTLGCIFYVLKKIPYMHSIFHLWVLAGSICQFLAIALYVM